jgi:GAF domain-containing protein
VKSSQKEDSYQNIIQQLESTFSDSAISSSKELYQLVVDLLSKLPNFHWTGIYLLEDATNELILEYYVGKPTEHTRIPVGEGVCGSAIAERTDKVIKDVQKEENYLACSLRTRSEIVVLIEDGDKIIGQIDVDSDNVGDFDEIDKNYLRQIAKLIVNQLNKI